MKCPIWQGQTARTKQKTSSPIDSYDMDTGPLEGYQTQFRRRSLNRQTEVLSVLDPVYFRFSYAIPIPFGPVLES